MALRDLNPEGGLTPYKRFRLVGAVRDGYWIEPPRHLGAENNELRKILQHGVQRGWDVGVFARDHQFLVLRMQGIKTTSKIFRSRVQLDFSLEDCVVHWLKDRDAAITCARTLM